MPAPPPGVVVMEFFSAKSQQTYGAVADEDLTTDPWNPSKYIPKAQILEECKKAGAISDWFPFQQIIQKFPGDEILLVWDENFEFGEEFYFCSTKAAEAVVIAMLAEKAPAVDTSKKAGAGGEVGADGQPVEEEEEEDEEYEIPEVREGPLIPGAWTDHGTAEEMRNNIAQPSRPPTVIQFFRRRREFGAPCRFNEHGADIDDMHLEVAQAKVKKANAKDAEEEKKPEWTQKKMLDFSFQASRERVEFSTQTDWNPTNHLGVQYESIVKDEQEALEELAAPAMSEFLTTVWPRYELALLLNAATDLYEDDFENMIEGDDIAQGSSKGDTIKEAYSFQDLKYSKNKKICAIDWHEEGKGTLGCAYVSKLDFKGRVEQSGLVSSAVVLVWDFADNINPQYVLEGPGDMFCFRFNPTNPEWVAAGCISGQVILWNLQTGRRAPATFEEQIAADNSNKAVHIDGTDFSPSLCETSHKRPITDMCWLPPEIEFASDGFISPSADGKSYQLATVSGDGVVLIWDIRVKKDSRRPDKDPIWNPLYKLALKEGGNNNPHGACQISVTTAQGAKFICTTEAGSFLHAEWTRMREDKEEDEMAVGDDDGTFIRSVSQGHFGPCKSLEKSPFFSDIWLTVGDWRFCIWKEGVEKPIFSSPFQSTYITCARWSPSRPSVLFVGREDGVMDVWDFLDRSHQPLTDFMFSGSITSMEFPKAKGEIGHHHYLAIGDDLGVCHVMRLPRMLTRPSRIEEKTIRNIFDRQVKQVSYIEQRSEFRGEERAHLESAAGADEGKTQQTMMTEKEIEEAEKHFQKLQEQFDKDMGLNQPEEEES